MFSYTNARRDNLFQTAFANQVVNIEKGTQKILRHGNLKILELLWILRTPCSLLVDCN